MKQLSCILLCATLTGCGHLAEYSGPSLRFSLGYNGIEAGVTLYSKKPVAASIEEAGKTFEALASPDGSSGKTPVVPSP